MRDLLDVAATLSSTPLDRSRPLWEFTLIEGRADGAAALLQRVHHTVTDGIGGLKLSLSLVDFERDPVPDVRETVRALRDEEHARELQDLMEDPLERDSPIERRARRARLRLAPEPRSGPPRRRRRGGRRAPPDRTAAPDPRRLRHGRLGPASGARRGPGEVAADGDTLARPPVRRRLDRPRGEPRRRARARRKHQRHLRHRRRRRARPLPRPARPSRRGAPHGDGGQHARRPRPLGREPVRADARRRPGHPEGAGASGSSG